MENCIGYCKETATFTLHTAHTSYVFCINELGAPEHLYYGARIPSDDLRYIRSKHVYSFVPYADKSYECVSPDVYFQEFPVENCGDFRSCALSLVSQNGMYGVRIRYESHTVRKGRLPLPDLPHSRGVSAESLEITFISESRDVTVKLHYVVYPAYDVIARYAEIVNSGENAIRLQRATSLALDLYGHEWDLIETFGTYQYERAVIQRTPLKYGKTGSFSHKGAGGHQSNPFMAVCRPEATEESGEVYGFNLIYSGNYENSVEVDALGNTRVLSGISNYAFDWELGAGERFFTPEAIMVYTECGLGGMSRLMHDFVREQIIPPAFAHRHRPVVLNTWEGCYYNVDELKLLSLAEIACRIGTEVLVLDDGWFRSNDEENLGDWGVDCNRFPHGLAWLSDRLHEKGLGFGLWFEPEMVNPKSRLYKEHPDWIVGSGSTRYFSRNQLVLDMGNPAVIDYLFDRISTCLSGVRIEYIKWDMNRFISEAGTSFGSQGTFFHRYILGVYELLRRISERFSESLIETCAGGGGRFDLGMLYYSPQIWASDATDPFLRTAIQLGTSLAYPNSAISSHVTDNVGSGLNGDMQFRYVTASFGAYGYELDVSTLSEEEIGLLLSFTEAQKESERLVLDGDLYRLINNEKFASWILVSKDKTCAVFSFVQFRYNALDKTCVVRIKGLNENFLYRSSLDGKIYHGATLMRLGVRIEDLPGNTGKAVQIKFERVNEENAGAR